MRYRFADCELDTDSYTLTRAGQPVAVEPQVFDLIRLLAENAGRLVTKDQMIEAIWQGRVVSEASISARISAARAAVGDTGQRQAVIRTQVRRGIEMVVPVEELADPAAPADPPPPGAEPPRQRIRYTTSADGTRLAWSAAGKGAPLLRLGHHLTHLELDWNSLVWGPAFQALAERHTLIRYDIRGAGLSERHPARNGLEAQAEDLEAVAAAAGLERFPMIATLQATPVAIRWIADNPGRVSRLVIQCGYARGRALRENAPADPAADPSIALLREGWGDPGNGYMRAWTSMFLPLVTNEEMTEFIQLLGAASGPDTIVEQRRFTDGLGAEAFLEKVDAPTLIIHPRSCAAHPLEEAQLMAAKIPDAELMVVEGANVICAPSDPGFDMQMAATLDFIAAGETG
jgi:DNA-binding winged helix-turn-helix (wHTH) protein/pimeloyl-ACP methyl ester carboxylesterase